MWQPLPSPLSVEEQNKEDGTRWRRSGSGRRDRRGRSGVGVWTYRYIRTARCACLKRCCSTRPDIENRLRRNRNRYSILIVFLGRCSRVDYLPSESTIRSYCILKRYVDQTDDKLTMAGYQGEPRHFAQTRSRWSKFLSSGRVFARAKASIGRVVDSVCACRAFGFCMFPRCRPFFDSFLFPSAE